MGLKDIAIVLDNQYNTYYPGQTVYGTAEVNIVDSPKKIRGICVKIKGEAHTEWCESKEEQTSDGKTESINTMHTAHEEYFQITYYILGSNSGNNEIELKPGVHKYNFTCALPPVLPSSFEGPFGYIRYTIKIILDRPWKFDQETKMAFTVVNAFDLNLNPSYKEPIHIQIEKVFCCFCCASAPLTVDVRSPVSGYVPGQVIPIKVDVENKSNVQVHLVKIYIRKLVTYRATSPANATKKTKDVIMSIQEGPAPAGSTKSWNLTLQLPPTAPSDLVNCNIIDLDYDFKVECTVSGMHMSLGGKKYIAVGTVPLLGIAGQPAPPQPEAPVSYPPSSPTDAALGGDTNGSPDNKNDIGWTAPNTGTVEPPYQQLYPSLSVPVYEKAQYASRNLQERGESQYVKVHGPEHFAPTYPTYAGVQPPPLPQ